MKNRTALIITYIVEFLNLVSLLFAHKLAADKWGTLGFAEYTLSRRIIALIAPVAVLGLDVAAAKFIAGAKTDEQRQQQAYYFISSSYLVCISAAFWMIVLNIDVNFFAKLILGSDEYSKLILPVSIIITSITINSLCVHYFRGKQSFVAANLLQMVNIGVFPIFTLWFNDRVEKALILYGVSVFALSSPVLIISIIREALSIKHFNISIDHCRELLVFGVQRMVTVLSAIALFALPTFITAHTTGIEKAGYVSFAISLITMMGAMFGPAGLVLLPRASRMIADGMLEKAYQVSKMLAILTTGLAAAFVIFLEISMKAIITSYLGSDFEEATTTIRIVLIGAIPYTLFIATRNVIDAYKVSLNTITVTFALGVFVITSAIAWVSSGNHLTIIILFAATLWVLGVLTINNIRKMSVDRLTQPSFNAGL